MGVRQVYRGNPALKSTYLITDLSNGIDIVNSDEVIATKSMRNLVNVELGEEGILKKRKGFSDTNILNEIIRDYYIAVDKTIDEELNELLDGVVGVHLHSDEQNVMNTMEEYSDLDDFKLAYGVENPSVKVPFIIKLILVHVSNQGLLNFISLEIENKADETVLLLNVKDLIPEQNRLNVGDVRKKTPLTGLEFKDFDNKVYLELSQISSNLTGFGVIEEKDGVVTAKMLDTSVNDENASDVKLGAYSPTPYEVVKYGFNVLADNPLDNTSNPAGAKRIYGIYLTDYNNPRIPLDVIPNDGKFRIVVMCSGFTSVEDLKLEIYQERDAISADLKIPLDFQTTYDNDNPFHYLVELSIPNSAITFISVYEETDISVDYVYNTWNDFVDEAATSKLKTVRNVNRGYDIYTNVRNGEKYYNWTILKKQLNNYYYIYDNGDSRLVNGSLLFSYVDAKYATDDIESATSFFNRLKSEVKWDGTIYPVIVYESLNDMYVAKYGYVWDTISNRPAKIDLGDDYNLYNLGGNQRLTLEEDSIIKINDDGKIPSNTQYFQYLNTNTIGTDNPISDFMEITEDDLKDRGSVAFTLYYEIGNPNDPKEIKAVDLKDSYMTIIDDRLVYYKNNTIVYSDVYKFNYFPFYNYITLPLDSDDTIMKIQYFKGAHIVFTRKSIWKLEGTLGYEDMRLSKVNDVIGCVARKSIQPLNNTLIFLSQDGLYALKQTMYANGLENVDKVDTQIDGLIKQLNNYAESYLYNGVYYLHLFNVRGSYVQTLKQYYNKYAGSSGRYPYVLDVYTKTPIVTFKVLNNIYALRDGKVYLFDKGYRDFYELYSFEVHTPNYHLDYPMHEKKLKDISLKVKSVEKLPVEVTVYYGDNVVIEPKSTKYNVNVYGEIEYIDGHSYGFETIWAELGDFTLGDDQLGGNSHQIHKLLTGGKSETIAMIIKQTSDTSFQLHAIDFTFKLGKIRGR